MAELPSTPPEKKAPPPSAEVLARWDASMLQMHEGTSRIFTNNLTEAENILRNGMVLPDGA